MYQDKTFRNGLVCYPGRCLLQTATNKEVFRKLGRTLSLKIGGFAILTPEPDWLWAPNGYSDSVNDCHVWLEDDKGKVYDIITPHMTGHVECLKTEDGKVFSFPFEPYQPIIGQEKQTLRSRGIEYRESANSTIVNTAGGELMILTRPHNVKGNETLIQFILTQTILLRQLSSLS